MPIGLSANWNRNVIYMKKVGIISIYDNSNFGNRLQAYALYSFLNKINYPCEQIKKKVKFKHKLKKCFKKYLGLIKNNPYWIRVANFQKFNRYIIYSRRFFYDDIYKYNKLDDIYAYFIVGSDQVWNPEFAGFDYFFLDFVKEKKKKISYAASIGLSEVDENYAFKMKKYLSDFNYISVREDAANEMLTKLTGRNDIKTLIDPTMLLTSKEWERVMKKPKIYKGEKYILLYFLGDLSEKRRSKIKDLAKKEGCKIIEILNPNDPYYTSGPAEFLFLEKNAKYIFTDSFHSSVFSVIFNVPFVIFDREENGMGKMNSRIDTLVSTLKLKDRWYNEEEITYENLHVDYTEAYKIIDMKRKESEAFLKQALSD